MSKINKSNEKIDLLNMIEEASILLDKIDFEFDKIAQKLGFESYADYEGGDHFDPNGRLSKLYEQYEKYQIARSNKNVTLSGWANLLREFNRWCELHHYTSKDVLVVVQEWYKNEKQ